MKTILALLLVAFTGCASVQKHEASIRPASALVCRGVLLLAVNAKDRADIANDIYAIAAVTKALSMGTAPTPAQFEAVLKSTTPKASEYSELASTLASFYAAAYPSMKGNPKLALQVLADIADGCTDAVAGMKGP
ncbi:MAG: hypothetical protein QOE26_2772 [Verrucomicrobiota bacterium]|jgi:hypothetical protein